MCGLEIVYENVIYAMGSKNVSYVSDFDPIPCSETEERVFDAREKKNVYSAQIYPCAIAKALLD